MDDGVQGNIGWYRATGQAANEEPSSKEKRARRVSLWGGEEDARQLAAAYRMVLSKVGGSTLSGHQKANVAFVKAR